MLCDDLGRGSAPTGPPRKCRPSVFGGLGKKRRALVPRPSALAGSGAGPAATSKTIEPQTSGPGRALSGAETGDRTETIDP